MKEVFFQFKEEPLRAGDLDSGWVWSKGGSTPAHSEAKKVKVRPILQKKESQKESVLSKGLKYWRERTLKPKKGNFQFSSIITVQPILKEEEIEANDSAMKQRIFLSEEESRQILREAKLFQSDHDISRTRKSTE